MFDKRKDGTQEGPKAHYDAGLEDLSASRQSAPANSGRSAVIGPKIKINGDIIGDENLIVEGQVKGRVDLKSHRVDIGAAGQVEADVIAKVVKVDGTVNGDIEGSEMVTISRTGNVRGNIKAPRMTLEDGAKFKGSIDMDPGDSARTAPKTETRNESKPSTDSDGEKARTASNGQGPIPEKAKADPGLPLKGS